MATNIDITFNSGKGNLDASLIRSGSEINKGSIGKTGVIVLPDAISGDRIQLDGICTGLARVIISNSAFPQVPLTTTEMTPYDYPTGPIHDIYIVS